MKSKVLIICMIMSFDMLCSSLAFSQATGYVKQIITANSGRFEFNPPYNDYVTLQTYYPQNKQTTLFGTIYTQSAQAILIYGHYAFVAAQDTIAKRLKNQR